MNSVQISCYYFLNKIVTWFSIKQMSNLLNKVVKKK